MFPHFWYVNHRIFGAKFFLQIVCCSIRLIAQTLAGLRSSMELKSVNQGGNINVAGKKIILGRGPQLQVRAQVFAFP